MSRVRSPNYPAISLPAALDRIHTIHKLEGRNATSREAIAKAIGFTSLNGASATILSALTKYGLLETAGDGEARVSELAIRAVHPESVEERATAINEAAFKPSLFAEIREKWPDRLPSDDSLRSFLVRRGFSSGALDQVIQFYRDTLDMVSDHEPAQSPIAYPGKETPMNVQSTASQAAASGSAAPPALGGKPFAISFDGSVLTGSLAITTVRDIDRLMRVLAAQKAAFEAMQEFQDDEYTADFEAADE